MSPNTPSPKKSDKLTAFQKGCIGMFISSGTVWYWLLRSKDLQTSLGVAYPWFLMGLTAFGLTCAAMSGSQIFNVIDGVRGFFSKREE